MLKNAVVLPQERSAPSMSMRERCWRTMAGWVLAAAVAGQCGCASISVRTSDKIDQAGARTLPDRIYVDNFVIPKQNLRVDRSDKKLMEFQAQFSQSLAQKMARNIDRSITPSKLVAEGVPRVPSNSWLVVGRFDKVNQGSRILRSTIGFGLGGTKVETTAIVYDLSGKEPVPLLMVVTTGGSNSVPGALPGAISPTPLAPLALGMLASNVGMGALPGLDADAKRTAREITAAISEYCADQGLIPKNKAMRPKRLGKLQIRFLDPARVKPKTAPTPAQPKGRVTVTPAAQ